MVVARTPCRQRIQLLSFRTRAVLFARRWSNALHLGVVGRYAVPVLLVQPAPRRARPRFAELEVYARRASAPAATRCSRGSLPRAARERPPPPLALARRGASGAAAIDGDLAAATDPGTRRRLIALVGIADPVAAPSLLQGGLTDRAEGGQSDRDQRGPAG